MLVQTFSGNETFRDYGTVRVLCLFHKDAASEGELPYKVARDPNANVRQIAFEQINAAESRNDLGKWMDARYDIPEGTYLTIKIERRDPTMRFGYKTTQMLLRLRETAALRRVRVSLTGAPKAVRTAGYIEGRFDVIDPGDFDKIGFATRYLEQFDPESRADAGVEVTVHEREIAPFAPPAQKQIVTTSGRRIALRKPGTRRRIRMGSNPDE